MSGRVLLRVAGCLWPLRNVAVAAALLAVAVGVGPVRVAPASPENPQSYHDLVVRDGAANYWLLDEASGSLAVDSIADRDLTGVPPTWGLEGPGPELAGAGFLPEQKLNHIASWPLDNFSVEAWFFSSSSTCFNALQEVVGVNNFLRFGADGWGVYVYAEPCGVPGTLRLNVRQVDVIGSATSPVVSVNEWHHVVVTRSNGVWSLYLDDTLVGTSSSGVPLNGNRFWIAQDFYGEYSGFYLNGGMSSVAFYTAVLTGPLVHEHYLAGLLGIPDTESPADDALVGEDVVVLETDELEGEVSYQYQLTLASDPSFASPIVDSGWLPTTSTFLPPEDALTPGQTYLWRVRSQLASGETSLWSGVAQFTHNPLRLGAREYWPIWSRGPISVNQANGNLVLGAPGPSFPTAVGSLSASATFNAHD